MEEKGNVDLLRNICPSQYKREDFLEGSCTSSPLLYKGGGDENAEDTNDVFQETCCSKYNIPDDHDLLLMCTENTDSINDPSSELNEGAVGADSIQFDMKGCIVNINNSSDITIGTKAFPSTGTSTISSSFPSMHNLPTSCDSIESLSVSSSVTSMGQFQNGVDIESSRDMFDTTTRSSPQEPRIFSEGISNKLASSYVINSFSKSPTPSTSRIIPTATTGSFGEFSSTQSKMLKKSMSTPSDTSSQGSSVSRNTQSCLPQTNTSISPKHEKMTTSLNNCKNVQVGTQIVYNFTSIPPDKDQMIAHCPTTHLPDPDGLKVAVSDTERTHLAEFKDKIVTVYQTKWKRSSPLPWHRGKQLIPINEYYTEPQIFTVDKCGNRTTETVNLFDILNSGTETRFLVEGEAGMGKTLLATKLAEEWARGHQLQQFKILLLVTLGDFKGSLVQYVREEILPSYFDADTFKKVWEYFKSHDNEILFVLDGYDELTRPDKGEIQNLIKSKDFPESKVVVTSRPNILQDWDKKIVVTGFGQIQIMEFIEKYFNAIGNNSSGQSLRRIIEREDKYWQLAKRPLFCVLLCMLYITGDVGESLPERQSDVMLQIILCLIKWNRKNDRKNDCLTATDLDSIPQDYEKPFYSFGRLCLNALKTEKSRFCEQEVQTVDGFETKLKQLGFLYNDNESHALGERQFWRPVHQTFLEYLGAFYMAKHLRECRGCKECKGYDSIFHRSHEVLKFCVGILNEKAYKLLDGQRFKVLWKLPVSKMLSLLKEAVPNNENCLAVAKLLDNNCVEISSSELEFEGWSHLLSQPFRRLTTLKIAWRIKSQSPDQESSFSEASEVQYAAFFEALRKNESIRCIHVRAKQDGEPFTEEKIAIFFSHLQTALMKKNLQELEIVEMKMTASGHLRAAIEGAAYQPNKIRSLNDLRVLKLHTFMKDSDLKGICEALQKSAPSLESLHLEGLEHGNAGFKSLVRLLKYNSNIRYLHLSMNQSLLVNIFESGREDQKDYPPDEMRTDVIRMMRTAARKSKNAFADQSNFCEGPDVTTNNAHEVLLNGSSRRNDSSSQEDSPCGTKDSDCSKTDRKMDPKKELQFLFDRLPSKNGQWTLDARRYWCLYRRNCSDLRIPLPLCVSGEHQSVFHYLFSALPETHVKNLTLTQAGLYLTTSDLVCLGDAVRKAPHLAVLNLQVLDKVDRYLPLLIGIGQSLSLTSVNFSSSKVVINDAAFEVVCAALQNNTSLRNLSLGKWQFHLQNFNAAKENLSALLGSWQVSHLDLKQCSIELSETFNLSQPQTPTSPISSPLTAFFPPPRTSSHPWRTLKMVNLEGVEVRESTGIVRRGHLLLPGLTNFINLSSLDLSMSHTRSIQVDNIALRKFFGLLGSELKQLTELKLGNWEFALQTKENDLSSLLKACRRVRKIQLERVNEIISESSITREECWCKYTFLHHLVSYLPQLEELSLCYYRVNNSSLDQDLALKIGNCLHDHFNHTPFSVKFFNLPQDVENTLYQTLKKNPFKVKRESGPSLIKTFEVRYAFLKKRPK